MTENRRRRSAANLQDARREPVANGDSASTIDIDKTIPAHPFASRAFGWIGCGAAVPAPRALSVSRGLVHGARWIDSDRHASLGIILTDPPPSLPERIRADEADVLMPTGGLTYLEWCWRLPGVLLLHGTPSSRLEGPSPMAARRHRLPT